MEEDTGVARSPPQLPIEVWQLVMDTVRTATTYSTFYTNQADYRSWALVSRAWCICAQTVLFHTVELPDAAHLYHFAALLVAAPHLAPYVRTLRAYSRDLHTRDNVVALLPAVLQLEGGLPNLRTILLTRITEQDTWHPHAARAPSDKELAYMSLGLSPGSPHTGYGYAGFCQRLEAHFAGVSELYLSYVTFETFDALAQVLHALRDLRLLSCLEVRWCALGPVPECLTWKGEGEGQGQGQGQAAFLPKLEDLTIAYMDLHGVERLLAALGRSATLKDLYIDCPHYSPVSVWDPPPIDPATGTPLGIDLRAFSQLASLWLALPYTQEVCKDLPELIAALLRTWTPTRTGAAATRKLTLTPSYESNFTRTEFADALRALGPVVEDVLDEDHGSHDREGGKADPGGASVEVCVVDKADMHEWWREVARASFVRLSARGSLAVSFEKSFWPEAHWLDDSDDRERDASSAVQHPIDVGAAQAHMPEERTAFANSVFGGGRASDGVARRRRGSSRLTRLRPVDLKRAFHVVQRSLSKLKLARLPWRKRPLPVTSVEAFSGI